MRRPGQEPRRAAVPSAAGARSGDGAAAEWEVQAARGQVTGAAECRGAAADSRGAAQALAETCRRAGDHGPRLESAAALLTV